MMQSIQNQMNKIVLKIQKQYQQDLILLHQSEQKKVRIGIKKKRRQSQIKNFLPDTPPQFLQTKNLKTEDQAPITSILQKEEQFQHQKQHLFLMGALSDHQLSILLNLLITLNYYIQYHKKSIKSFNQPQQLVLSID
ncbi:unnamed protein product [Paramecium pentaurelia]|uniref:Uncharacterized protein n=1 Tax=Paramecium pentaurelia TaxID=43138 RepID=A0A8S1S6M9_9CILI|nr:unnamed protein product [Paramecium pentaurelia]